MISETNSGKNCAIPLLLVLLSVELLCPRPPKVGHSVLQRACSVNETAATPTCHCKAISMTVAHLPGCLNAMPMFYSSPVRYCLGLLQRIATHRSECRPEQSTRSLKPEPRNLMPYRREWRTQIQREQRPSSLSSASLGDATGIYVWGD